MKLLIAIISFLFLTIAEEPSPRAFRDEQLKYTRIREAYAEKEKAIVKSLSDFSISRDSLRLYLRAFKTEKVIEVWAKNVSDSDYLLVKKIPICEISGTIGPKRRYKDLQVPEGFYHITNFNPYSKYYLSMQINYPNGSDSIRGVQGHLGNLIFIHGECVSSGCLAINNDRIKELFVYCIEAYNSGQKTIEIAIFPSYLSDKNYTSLNAVYRKDKDKISLWADLKKGYDIFNQSKELPSVKFLPDGTHDVK